MEHFKDEWFHEIRLMREAMMSGKQENFDISYHAFIERMAERDISITEIAEVIMTGEIIEGFDIGQYPNYRNPDVLRTIVGETSSGKLLSVGVAFQSYNKFRVTTVYEGVANRLLSRLQLHYPSLYKKHYETSIIN